MTGRLLPPGLHGLVDVMVGDRIETGRAAVTAELISDYATLSGDHFEIHLSESAAARHGFAGRVAHGLLVLALTDGLKNTAPAQIRAQASLGWDWRFVRPVLAGDEIRAVLTVAEIRGTRHLDRGIVCFEVDVLNQSDEIVQAGTNRLMAYF